MQEESTSRSELVPSADSSSSSSDEDDCVQPVVQVPPSHFSNVSVQNSTNVHFGNSAVYNGDVTVIMSPGVDDLVASGVDRLQLRDKKLMLSSGQPVNLDDDEKNNLAVINKILIGAYEPQVESATVNEKNGK